MQTQNKVEVKDVRTVEDGAEEFIPEIQINELGNRKLDIYLRDNKLSVDIDNKVAVKDLPISIKGPRIYLFRICWGIWL